MKKILLLILSLSLFAIAAEAQSGWNWNSQNYYNQADPSAQSYYDKGSQIPVTSVDPSICFEPGWDFGGYFSALFPNNAAFEDAYGGGISLSYFFDRNIGLELNYAAHGQGASQQVLHANAIYRLPIEGCFCGAIAPYVFGGGGFTESGQFDMLYDVGAGLEIRLQSWGCVAFFTDYSYNFVEKGGINQDFSQWRAGFKLPF